MAGGEVTRRSVIAGTAVGASALVLRASLELPRILVCGGSAVYDAGIAGDRSAPRWEDVREWRAAAGKGLPESYLAKAFETTDECKPIDRGRSVLLTASSGGVVIFERESLNALFHARVANAHSACMLPGGYLVVASSVSAEGNALVLFHRSLNEHVVFRTPLESAHGVVWDEGRETLYALGMDRLEEYSFVPGASTASGTTLRLLRHTPLPSRGGHDLSPSSRDELTVTTQHGVYQFHQTARRFRDHRELGSFKDVKCVSTNLSSGQVAWVKADEGEGVWWSFRIRFLNPAGDAKSPGQRVYKVRWA